VERGDGRHHAGHRQRLQLDLGLGERQRMVLAGGATMPNGFRFTPMIEGLPSPVTCARMLRRGQLPHWSPDRLSIKERPRPKEAYWIGVFDDSVEPEFTGYHPGIIIRGARSTDIATQTVSFVPITTKAPRVDEETGTLPPYIYQLAKNPNPRRQDPCWAICNHIITVRLTRLERFIGDGGAAVVPKISSTDFTGIIHAIRRGFGVIESHIKAAIGQEVAAHKASLDAEHARRLADIEREVAARAAARAMEILDELTRPAGDSRPEVTA
jgi:uncharacterized protein YifN (PemK superfamily)